MDEPQHTMGGKPYMVSLCPFYIGTIIGYIGTEHCSKIGHFLTAFTLGEPFGIDTTLFCLRIEKLTPGVQVDYQQTPVHRLLMTAQAALGAFVLPGGGGVGGTAATHGSYLQRALPDCSGHLAVWEGGWRGL